METYGQARVTPRHDRFIQAIANSPIHIIANMRGKDQYEVEKDDRGKTSIKKLGVGAKQREGFEYEFTCTFNIDQATHIATPQKDNTHIFENEVNTILSEDYGSCIIKWANSGEGYTPRAYSSSSATSTTSTSTPSGTVTESEALNDKISETKSLVESLIANGISKTDIANAIKKYHIVNGKASANYQTIKDALIFDSIIDELKTLIK